MGLGEHRAGSMLADETDGCCGGRVFMERCGADPCPGRGGDAAARHPASNKTETRTVGSLSKSRRLRVE